MRQTMPIAAVCALMAAGCAQIEARNEARQAEAQFAPADASPDAPDCFYAREIRGYSQVDRDTVRIRLNLRDYYDVTVTPTCSDLTWANGVAVVSRSANLCVDRGPNQGDVIAGEQRCPILSIAHSQRRPEAASGP